MSEKYKIMPPWKFNELSMVRGFNKINGKTYQEHIIIILGHLMTSEDQKRISEATSTDEALTNLSNTLIYSFYEYKK